MLKVKKDQICVIHSNSKIESLYTLFPFIVSPYSHMFHFIYLKSKEASTIEGNCVILVRIFKGDQVLETDIPKKRAYLMDFKRRFNKIIILDDDAGSNNIHFEYLDLVDLYFKGKLIKDRSQYLRPMYGRHIFTDYYHRKYGIADVNEKDMALPSDTSMFDKLRVSWNLGYGVYPMPGDNLVRITKFITKSGFIKALKPWYIYQYKQIIKQLNISVDYSKKVTKVQARFNSNSLPKTIGYQRSLFNDKCSGKDYILSGRISSKLYNEELKTIAAVLSPFGWGEICFRDFEAVFNGSLLIKPNMDHIETWPNIYKGFQTYVPVEWDGNNLIEVITSFVQNKSSYEGIMETARNEYKKSLLDMNKRVESFLEEIS